MLLLGYDIGSSSIKAALVHAETGETIAAAAFPTTEMHITSLKTGWAEQNPQCWWTNLRQATQAIIATAHTKPAHITAIGIAYQMHGLVLTNNAGNPLRNAIIWCDSRAVPYGEKALADIGAAHCLPHTLNSPGNFTLAKLAWVKKHEPHLYAQTKHYMLPGDYIALRLTGEATTTAPGLSEGIGWDFTNHAPATFLYNYFGFDTNLIPPLVPTFGIQGRLTPAAAQELGLAAGTPLTYRAGDQPNNALSLNVLQPGEIAATAGTSGVVYGINNHAKYDPLSRINSFAHVNHTPEQPRIGALLCINGTAILNAWIRTTIAPEGLDYNKMNTLAATIPIGSEGVTIIPFGNGAERILCHREPGCSIHGLQFTRHHKAHLIRAAQEGIAFSFKYGIDIMNNIGIETRTIRAGHANLFLSPTFRQTLTNITGATIELYNTDGATGAARGAGIGANIYRNTAEALAPLKKTLTLTPEPPAINPTKEAYERWLTTTHKLLEKPLP
jgi:xylulokinase